MTMTCRGGLSDSHEHPDRIEARAKIVQQVAEVRSMLECDPELVVPKILL
jgi:hypothetical protein